LAAAVLRPRTVLRPCQAVADPFEGDCRSRLGDDSRRHWDAGLSMWRTCPWHSPPPLLPAAWLSPPATPCRGRWKVAPPRPPRSASEGRRPDHALRLTGTQVSYDKRARR